MDDYHGKITTITGDDYFSMHQTGNIILYTRWLKVLTFISITVIHYNNKPLIWYTFVYSFLDTYSLLALL
jgi:hypothetical protein